MTSQCFATIPACARRRSRCQSGASTLLGGSALARAPKLGTQTPYWHRFILGDAEVTVVSDGPLPLGDPSGTFTGVPKEEVKKMLSDNFLRLTMSCWSRTLRS